MGKAQLLQNNERTVRHSHPAASPEVPATSAGDALAAGTRMFEFEITALIGKGGFGIVYLAYDHSLQRQVALKEFMPPALAVREPDGAVSARAGGQIETFRAGLRSFVNEAQLLAQFDHPSLVKVHRFWEAKGTAYTVMPYYEGQTLKQTLSELGGPPDEAWLKDLLRPLLDAIDLIHSAQCFHRDIAPDNILILERGRPVLLDFGAARRVISDMTHDLTAILKPGFAPVEQYDDMTCMRQGAWTDIYALACVVYFAITGKTPRPSVTRLINDNLEPLSKLAAGRYSAEFLRGIDRAMAVNPEDRPQSVAEFRTSIGLTDRRQQPRTTTPTQAPAGSASAASVASGLRAPSAAMPEPIATDAQKPAHIPAPKSAARHKPSPQRAQAAVSWAYRQSPIALLAIGAIVLGTAIAVGTQLLRGTNAPKAETTVRTWSSPAPALTPSHTVTLPDLNNLPATSAGPGASSAAEQAAVAPPRVWDKPFSPEQMIEDVYQARDRNHVVTVSMEKSQLRIGKDEIRFRIRSAKPGYVYVLSVGRGRYPFDLLFPNAVDYNNRIVPDQVLELPGVTWPIGAHGPAGTRRLIAIVSESPRDFTGLEGEPDEVFLRFPPPAAGALYEQYRGTSPLFAGKAICGAGSPCPEAYGAASFAVEEIPNAPEQRVAASVMKPEPAAVPDAPNLIPQRTTSPERCRDIIQRVSLGESLTADDSEFLKKECRT